MSITNCAVEMTVNGRPVKVYNHEGKNFIEARDGSEYEIKIKNNFYNRVMAVASVDGLDVLTGEPANLNGNGYVIEPYGWLTIKGFRRTMDDVGAFKFTKKEQSYASEKGQESNVGVIAVAFFHEKVHYPVYNITTDSLGGFLNSNTTTYSTSSSTSFNLNCSTTTSNSNLNSTTKTVRSYGGGQSASLNNETFKAGTTWGEKKIDKVTTTTFEKASESPFQIGTFYYDFKDGLEKMGIKLVPEKNIVLPNPFPGQFAEPPKNWL